MIVKRKRLSLAEKNHLLDEVETGQVKKVAIAKKWGIADRTLRVIVNQKDKWRKAYVEGRSETIYSTRTTPFPRLDSELMAWLGIAMQLGLPVTHKVLSNKALSIRDSMLRSPDVSEFDRDVLARFTASKGWVIRFCRRNHLKPVKLGKSEKDASCNSQGALSMDTGQGRLLQGFSLDQGCIDDGSGMYYKLLSEGDYEHEDLAKNDSIRVFRQNDVGVLDTSCRMGLQNSEGKDAGLAQFPLYNDLVGPLGELEDKLLPVGDAEVNSLLQKLRRAITEKQGGSTKID